MQTDVPAPPDLTFVLADGMRLPARQFLPPTGAAWRGVILALHGYTDSRDGWEVPGPVFARAGYAVFAPDLRGFGGAPDRGDWVGTARLVDDAGEMAAQLGARFPGKRLVVMGESMGGAVALCLAARPHPPADAFVLLSPAVGGWRQMDPRLSAILLATDAVAPGWAPNPGDIPVDVTASDNRAALIRMGRDQLTLLRPTVASMRGVVDLMSDAQAAVPRLHGDVLILDGTRDQIVPPAATAAAWAKLPPGVRRAVYPNGYHLLLRDRDRALVEADILSWLGDPGAWLPSGADAAAAIWQSDQAWAGPPAGGLPAAALDGMGVRRVWPY